MSDRKKPPTKQIEKYQQQPKWKNQPTKSIRVPEVFLADIEAYARGLDNGKKPRLDIEALSLEELIKLKADIERLIEKREVQKEQLPEKRIEIDCLLESKQERIELVLKGKRKTLKGLQSPKELAKELLEIL